MIFQRMAGVSIFHKVKHLETLSRSSLLTNSCRPPQFGRTSTNLASINRSLNSNVASNKNSCLLKKFPVTSTISVAQSRAASTHGDHVRLWVFERLVSVALPILIPTALLVQNPFVDCILATATVMHTHWGLEAIIMDYARPIVVGPILPKVLFLALNVLSAVTLAGLFVLIYNGPGISKAIKDAWSIGKKERA